MSDTHEKENEVGEVVITLEVEGEMEEYRFAEGTPDEEVIDFVNSRMGIEPEYPTEVRHPDLEFAKVNLHDSPEPDGLRVVCSIKGCEHTEVFGGLGGFKDSEWTELGMPKGGLTEGTELHYAFCPSHSTSESEGYDPEKDMGSHKFDGGVPNSVRWGLHD